SKHLTDFDKLQGEETNARFERSPWKNFVDQSARKMSKINTLLLACNWIRQLTIRNHELQKQVAALRAEDRISVPIGPPPPSSQPTNAFTMTPGPISFALGPTPCMKAFGQACFCIGCLTMGSKQ
ncbi:hypothetical protein OSTOST_08291, partial [Ostertagia ostertagi]